MAKCCGNWKRCSKKVSECTQIKGEKTKTSKKRTPWRRPSFGFYPPLLFFWAVENSTEIVENIQKEIAMGGHRGRGRGTWAGLFSLATWLGIFAVRQK